MRPFKNDITGGGGEGVLQTSDKSSSGERMSIKSDVTTKQKIVPPLAPCHVPPEDISNTVL